MEQLRDFSQADEEDMEVCRGYFDELSRMAEARLEFIEVQYPRAGDVLYRRLLRKMAFDRQRAVVKQLALTGEIPEGLAERIHLPIGLPGSD
jgi:hypothetical protein